MHVPSLQSLQEYAKVPLSLVDNNRLAARSGVVAGAALVALSAASAVVTALRERSTRS